MAFFSLAASATSAARTFSGPVKLFSDFSRSATTSLTALWTMCTPYLHPLSHISCAHASGYSIHQVCLLCTDSMHSVIHSGARVRTLNFAAWLSARSIWYSRPRLRSSSSYRLHCTKVFSLTGRSPATPELPHMATNIQAR